MQTPKDLKEVWKDLSDLIETLPPEQRRQYQTSILKLIHDLRQPLSVIFSAEGLLRRKLSSDPDNIEMLDIIREANKRAMNLLTDFAHPFDGKVTVALGKSLDELDRELKSKAESSGKQS